MQQVTQHWQGHLGETETLIGETELLGFLVVAMSYELGGPDRKNQWGRVGV